MNWLWTNLKTSYCFIIYYFKLHCGRIKKENENKKKLFLEIEKKLYFISITYDKCEPLVR